jgi:anti-anti-sigma factor
METQVLEANLSRINGVPVIDIHGEINSFAQKALDKVYDEAESTGSTSIILNFQNVGYINSTGIALIVNLLSRARKNGRTLIACGLSQHYQEIFELTRLSQFIRIYPNVPAAIGAINSPN